MIPRRHRITAGVVLSSVCALVIAASSGGTREVPAPAGPVFLMAKGDCTISMRRAMPDMPKVAASIARDAVRTDSVVMAGTFAGDPGRSPDPWPVLFRFGDEFESPNRHLTEERRRAKAAEVARRVQRVMGCGDAGTGGGSPLLSVLEDASDVLRTARVPNEVERRLVVLSDGGVVGDGLDVRRGIADREIDAAVKRFAGRLRGLRGARVWIIGAGSGTTVPRATMRQVRKLFARVLEAAGARLESFGPSAVAYPLETQP